MATVREALLHAVQLPLPGIPAKPTSREKRQYVQERLHGFELRQAARNQRRKDMIAARETRERERLARKGATS